MYVVCGIGTLAYLWTSAPRGWRPRRNYEITKVTPFGDAIAVDLAPKGRPLRHRAGQFAFFRFSGANLNEPHPFTISSAPNDTGTLRLTVAPLGDLTARVSRALAAGQAVEIDGPYGHFGRAKGPQVWIGAGIGITPFVALAQALPRDAAPVTLIYCLRDTANAAHLEELQTLAAENPALDLILWTSPERGRLTAKSLAATLPDLASRKVLFCGPTPMRRTLSETLPAQGVPQKNFHYEAFEIRTGLGIRRFADWLWTQREKRMS